MVTSEEILNRLKDSGYRFTGKRKKIVDLFLENDHKFLTARDLLEQMKVQFQSVSYDTIYRTLALLLQFQVIEEMEYPSDANRYRLVRRHESHHHHLVCVACGKIAAVEPCPMEFLQLKFDDFHVVNHRFEVYGYCSSCTQTQHKRVPAPKHLLEVLK